MALGRLFAIFVSIYVSPKIMLFVDIVSISNMLYLSNQLPWVPVNIELQSKQGLYLKYKMTSGSKTAQNDKETF